MTTIQLILPDDLAQQAASVGLLSAVRAPAHEGQSAGSNHAGAQGFTGSRWAP